MEYGRVSGETMTELTFGSLFAGIGGFDLGFERAGYRCKWQVENDEYANKVLSKNWPDVRRHEDIRTFPPDWEEEWSVDVVTAGFPCQDISRAGKQVGIYGEKSGLVFEVFRVARRLRPRALVLENVSGLRSGGLAVILRELASIGYDAEWHSIPAGHIGALHIRDRVYIMALLSDTDSVGRQVRESRWKNAHNAWKLRRGSKFGIWSAEPNVGRVVDGVPRRVDRIRGLGNAVVPQMAELIAHRVRYLLDNS